MMARILFSLFLMAVSIDLTAFQQLPDYFINPPLDSSEEIFAIGVAQTEESAFAIAMDVLAGKVESIKSKETENYSSISNTTDESTIASSNLVQNQSINRFRVQSLTKNYTEETSSGEVLTETYEQAIKIYYKADENCSFIIEHIYNFSIVDGEEDEKTGGGVNWANCAFSHGVRYIEENPDIAYQTKVVMDNWYTLVSLKTSAITDTDE
jgi:hypothetical protein